VEYIEAEIQALVQVEEQVYIGVVLAQGLELGMVVELEQGMVEEQVLVCIEEVLEQELVQDMVVEQELVQDIVEEQE